MRLVAIIFSKMGLFKAFNEPLLEPVRPELDLSCSFANPVRPELVEGLSRHGFF
jgi:hypothetical protein